jgi:hypothetical protein
MTNITDFCELNKIQWFPINLNVKPDGKDDLGNVKYKKIPSYPNQVFSKKINPLANSYKSKCDYNDFINKTQSEIKERHNYIDKCNALVIDTNHVYIIDVDFKDNIDYEKLHPDTFKIYNKMIELLPYKKSSTKKQGRHLFCKSNNKFKKTRIQTNLIDIEILAGQWAYSNKNDTIENFKDEIPYFDLNEIIENKQLDKKKTDIIDSNIDSNIDDKDKDKNKDIKKQEFKNTNYNKLKDIADLIDIKYIDEYDSWTKIVWSLANDNKKNYHIAQSISSKSSKYDEKIFNKIWNSANNGNSIATVYYYSKLSNESKFYETIIKYGDESNFSQSGMAQMYLNENDNLVYKNDILYVFYQNIWYEDRKLLKLKYLLGIYLEKLLKKIIDTLDKKVLKATSFLEFVPSVIPIEEFKKKLSSVQSANGRKNIADCIIQRLSTINFDDIEFDKNGYLLPFRNKIYDLENHIFRSPKKDDYILTYIPYDITEKDDNKIKFWDDKFNQIFPDIEIKDNYVNYLCTCLYGIQVEKFIIANGDGRNGKGLINESMSDMLGPFCYNANNTVLLNPLKEGINVQVANMHNRRMIIYTEPEAEQKKINGSTMKELTGGKGISAERKFSNDDKIKLCGTHILECNKKPKIDGRIDNSYLNRIADIPFKAYFTTNKEDLEDKSASYVYEANTFYKTQEFRDSYKIDLFYYLINHIKNYKKIFGYDIIKKFVDCDEVKLRTRGYLDNSDNKYLWFCTYYSKKINNDDDDNNQPTYVLINDVYKHFRQSDYYINMSKKDKREFSYKTFVEYISQHSHLSRYHKEKYQYKKNDGTPTCVRNVLMGYYRNSYVENGGDEIDDGIC